MIYRFRPLGVDRCVHEIMLLHPVPDSGERPPPADVVHLDMETSYTTVDGFTLAGKIRQQDEHIPILFLSARSMKEDRIQGLTLGGDDYITKPFSMEELALKIEVFLRRGRVVNADRKRGEYTLGQYRFIPLNMELIHPKGTRRLTSRETELLKLFIQNLNTVLKKEDILREVWGSDSYFNSRSLDVFISKLRKHLSQDPSVTINNIHGIGFIMVVNG